MNLVISYQTGNDFSYLLTTGSNFKSDLFGKWIPISISMYRSTNPTLFPVMASATVYYNLLNRNNANFNSYVISEITFSNNFLGLISNIQILNSFAINPWELAKE